MPVYTSQYFGGIPTISVATFANLPASGTIDQRIAITGESALFDTTTYPAVVRWSGNAWELESCAATYLNVAAVEFASGTWTGTGGTVGTKSGAAVVDTTYNESWVWNSTSNIFVPRYLELTAIGNQKKMKGDNATLETGWTVQADIGSTLVVDGGNKLLATATSDSSNSRYSRIFFTDTTATGTTNNFYMKCLVERTTWTRATTGRLDLFIRHDTGNGGCIVEFSDADTSSAGTYNGKFSNRVSGTGTTYTATANRGDTGWQSETLVQFRVIAGATNAEGVAQVKIGTGAWHDISVGTCRTGGYSTRFEIGVLSNNSPTNIAAMKLRYLQAIRYT